MLRYALLGSHDIYVTLPSLCDAFSLTLIVLARSTIVEYWEYYSSTAVRPSEPAALDLVN